MDSEEESRLLSHEDARLDRQQMIKEEKDQETSDEEGKKSQKPSSSYSELHSGISEIMIKGASISTPGEGSLVQICDFNGKKFNSGKVLGDHGRYHIPAERKMKKQRKMPCRFKWHPSLAPIPEAMKPELPLLQYLETQQGSWDANASSLPSLESADTMFQSSPVEQYQSFVVTPDSDGLLESIIYDTRLPRGSNNNDSLWNTTYECMLNVARTETELDTNSPFGHSSASVQTVYTPPVSINSVDDPHHMEHTRAGHEMRQEAISQGATHVGHSQETSSQIDLTTWADSLLDLGWSGNETSDL